jgi:hypothetical protein
MHYSYSADYLPCNPEWRGQQCSHSPTLVTITQLRSIIVSRTVLTPLCIFIAGYYRSIMTAMTGEEVAQGTGEGPLSVEGT